VKFLGEAGQTVRLKSGNLGPGTDTYFTLYASDGTRLARNDDFGDTAASRIDFTPEVDGTYFLRMHQYGGVGGVDRTYKLTVRNR
jgi:hypothetical protein